MGDMKSLKISVCFYVMSDLDYEANKDIFSKALEIVREKFPFPDTRILRLAISGNFEQLLCESGAIPRLILLDDTSDSEDEN